MHGGEVCGLKSVEPSGLEATELSRVFAWLDSIGFSQTSRWPLFAARSWSSRQEIQAWKRYRSGLCNLQEVAIPRLYWRGLPPVVKRLFRALTLGEPLSKADLAAELFPLLGSDGQPKWRVIPRFGRYILASPPDLQDEQFVYFGDDTLYLMQRGRELLARSSELRDFRVLDLCCGGGGVGLGLPVFHGSLLGVDINPQAIELARLATEAQGLESYRYHLGTVEEVLESDYDLVIGNPPSLPPEIGARTTVYASGSTARWLEWLVLLENRLSDSGRLLVTVFSVADGPASDALDPLRGELTQRLRRGFRYTVRRQFPMAGGRWLRHVALELLPQEERAGEEFVGPSPSLQLPALAWRRRP